MSGRGAYRVSVGRVRLRTTLVAACVALIATPQAFAQIQSQQGSQGYFGIAPATKEATGHPPLRLDGTTVLNTTKASYRVRVHVAMITQDVSGGYSEVTTHKSLVEAARILEVSPTRFDLGPNRLHVLSLRWKSIPPGDKAAYIGLIVTGLPAHASAEQLRAIPRIIGVNFLRLPGKFLTTGKIVALTPTEEPGKKLAIVSRVRNTGNIDGIPEHGHTVVLDTSGAVVESQDWQPGVILPGAERDFPVVLKSVLPAGNYQLVSAMRFGGKLSILRKPMRLVGPNQLPTANLAFSTISASGDIDGPAEVRMGIENRGTLVITPEVSVVLRELTGSGGQGPVVARAQTKAQPLGGHGQVTTTVHLGKLHPGTYSVEAVLSANGKEYDRGNTTFGAVKNKSFWERFKDFISEHGAVLGLGLAVLVILALLLALRRSRRRREDEPATSATASPGLVEPGAIVPAAAGIVNINTASADELQRLPGVGPRAAQRIVDHRDEFGAFTSLEGLAEADGFGTKRIEAIRDLADV